MLFCKNREYRCHFCDEETYNCKGININKNFIGKKEDFLRHLIEEHGNKIIDYHENIIPKDEKYRMRNVAFNLHTNSLTKKNEEIYSKKKIDYLIDIDRIINDKKLYSEDFNNNTTNKYKDTPKYNFDNINNNNLTGTDEFDFFEQLPNFGKNKENSSFNSKNKKENKVKERDKDKDKDKEKESDSSFMKRLKEKENDLETNKFIYDYYNDNDNDNDYEYNFDNNFNHKYNYEKEKEKYNYYDNYDKYDINSNINNQINRNKIKNINVRLNEMDEKINREKLKEIEKEKEMELEREENPLKDLLIKSDNDSYFFDRKNSLEKERDKDRERERDRGIERDRDRDFMDEFYKTFKELKEKENELELNNSIDIDEFIKQKEKELEKSNNKGGNKYKSGDTKSQNSKINLSDNDYGYGDFDRDKALVSKPTLNEYFDDAYLIDNEDIFEEIKENNDSNLRKHLNYRD
jgi:hypothetical protein